MKKWERLKSGDVIDIIAPGFAAKPEDLAASVNYLQSRGYKPRVPQNLLQAESFHSSSDENRFQHLKNALLATDSKAIWCLRGGYGSNRLIPLLSKVRQPKNTKVMIGISDITSIHLFLNQKWKWPSLHACLLERISSGKLPPDLEQELWMVLQGASKNLQYTQLRPLNQAAKKMKALKGSVVGGNLTVLQTSLGTPYQISTRGKFLFLEDIGERGYRVDRMLEHMKQAGAFKGCLAILIGHFIRGEEPQSDLSLIPLALERFAKNSSIPVWDSLPTGHDIELRTLPLGTPATLRQQNGSGVLSCDVGVR